MRAIDDADPALSFTPRHRLEVFNGFRLAVYRAQ